MSFINSLLIWGGLVISTLCNRWPGSVAQGSFPQQPSLATCFASNPGFPPRQPSSRIHSVSSSHNSFLAAHFRHGGYLIVYPGLQPVGRIAAMSDSPSDVDQLREFSSAISRVVAPANELRLALGMVGSQDSSRMLRSPTVHGLRTV